jgi:glucosamine--fructose-6-phosphate aminotransferase (isomerizing)
MTNGLDSEVRTVAGMLAGYRSCFILGKGDLFPLALEGALKLKEVSKIHAEGYQVGEFGHGPLALADKDTPVIIFSFDDGQDSASFPLVAELKRRGAPLVLISEGGPAKDQAVESLADYFLPLPVAPVRLRPVVAVIPLQLLAYHLGVINGYDVDRPGGTLSPEIQVYNSQDASGNGKRSGAIYS